MYISASVRAYECFCVCKACVRVCFKHVRVCLTYVHACECMTVCERVHVYHVLATS